MTVSEIKKKAEYILASLKEEEIFQNERMVNDLKKIIENEIPDNIVEVVTKELEYIDDFLFWKRQMIISRNDYEILKNLAKRLRNQRVRKEEVSSHAPLFNIEVDEGNEVEFISKDAADIYVRANNVEGEKVNSQNDKEKRKKNIFKVEENKNLELETLLQIIKRNY